MGMNGSKFENETSFLSLTVVISAGIDEKPEKLVRVVDTKETP